MSNRTPSIDIGASNVARPSLVPCGIPESSSPSNARTLVVFGAAKTGKSSIIRQFLYQKFETEYRATIEDVYNRKFEVNGSPLEVQFIDTGGLYNFPAMRKLCIRKACGYILVFSLTDPDSLTYLDEVLDQINSSWDVTGISGDTQNQELVNGNSNEHELKTNDSLSQLSMPLVIIGNKLDLPVDKQIKDDKIQNWLQSHHIPDDCYFQCSAKEEDNIWDVFTHLYHQYTLYYHVSPPQTSPNSFPHQSHEPRRKMANNIRRLSAFAALAISPSQFRSFFGPQFNSELIKSSSTASSTSSSSNISPLAKSKIKRNSRPSIARASKDFTKHGKIKEPIKVDCVIS